MNCIIAVKIKLTFLLSSTLEKALLTCIFVADFINQIAAILLLLAVAAELTVNLTVFW